MVLDVTFSHASNIWINWHCSWWCLLLMLLQGKAVARVEAGKGVPAVQFLLPRAAHTHTAAHKAPPKAQPAPLTAAGGATGIA
jgi:hypothetical protein